MKDFLRSISRLVWRSRSWVLCAGWLGLALVFVWLASSAFGLMHTKLPRAGFRLPARPVAGAQLGNLRFQDVVNEFADKHDQTVAVLEEAVQQNARTGFFLNLTCAFLGWLGFLVQLCGAARTDFRRRETEPEDVQITFRARDEEPYLAAQIHQGSFPDAGYGR